MNQGRQSFGVCSFNDKYIFVFGGKRLLDGANNKNINQIPYEFVNNVEVFKIEKNQWKLINYVSESNRLSLLNPGCFQVTGKKILIFGGIRPADEEHNNHPAIESGKKVNLSNETFYFNVTNGETVSGADMARPSYFISGSFIFP
jgi:Galactose oxidase, central domain